MNYSDDVRDYCKRNYIDPARKNNIKTVTIISGNVHNALKYKDRYPLVCAALGSKKFEILCNIERISINGSANSSRTEFKFRIL